MTNPFAFLKKRLNLPVLTDSALLLGAGIVPHLPRPYPPLKEAYKNYFSVGVAVAPRNLTGQEADLIKQPFNSITPENAMKTIRPQTV